MALIDAGDRRRRCVRSRAGCRRSSRSSCAPIPSSGEQLPVIGLGSSATFSQVARREDVTALSDVFKALVDGGGTVFDTAPGYGASEEVAGRIVGELKLTDKIFWATKVNVAGGGRRRRRRSGGGARADRDVVHAHQEGEDRSDPGAQPGRRADAAGDSQGVQAAGAHPLHRRDHHVRSAVQQICRHHEARAARLHRRRLRRSTPARPRRPSCRWRRSARSACSPTSRSAARGCGIASAIGRCPTRPRSSTPRPGRSSSSSSSPAIRPSPWSRRRPARRRT